MNKYKSCGFWYDNNALMQDWGVRPIARHQPTMPSRCRVRVRTFSPIVNNLIVPGRYHERKYSLELLCRREIWIKKRIEQILQRTVSLKWYGCGIPIQIARNSLKRSVYSGKRRFSGTQRTGSRWYIEHGIQSAGITRFSKTIEDPGHLKKRIR